jgi:hypothetical protein
MQEDIEHRSVAITVQAGKLTAGVLKKAILATLRKMNERRSVPRIGQNSMKRLTGKDGAANNIEVAGRIRSFERIAKKHRVRYRITRQKGSDPPKWTVYFRGGQADAVTDAFKEYTRKELVRDNRPSLLTQLRKFKELTAKIAKEVIKSKEHGGPEL